VEVIASFPGSAGISGTENAAFLVGGLDAGIYDVRVHRRYGDSDTTKVLGWNATLELFPGRSGVCRLVEGAFGTAIQKGVYMTAPLVSRRIYDFRVARIERHVGDTGVFAYGQDIFPGLSGIGGFEQTPVAAGPPQRSLCRHIDGIGMFG